MLGERIANLRKKRKLSQYELAERLGFSRGKLANYEQGSRQPDYDTLKKIADYFDVTTDYLLGRERSIHLYDKDQNPADDYILTPIDWDVVLPKGTIVLVSDLKFQLSSEMTIDGLFIYLSSKYDLKEFTHGDMSRFNVTATYKLKETIKSIAEVSLDGQDFSKKIQKEEKDIAKRMEQIKKDLTSEDGLMFNGEPMSEEAVDSFLEAMEYAVRQTQRINKKYIPKKYRNNEDN